MGRSPGYSLATSAQTATGGGCFKLSRGRGRRCWALCGSVSPGWTGTSESPTRPPASVAVAHLPPQNVFAAVGRGLYVYNLPTKRLTACHKAAHDSSVLHIAKLPNRCDGPLMVPSRVAQLPVGLASMLRDVYCQNLTLG